MKNNIVPSLMIGISQVNIPYRIINIPKMHPNRYVKGLLLFLLRRCRNNNPHTFLSPFPQFTFPYFSLRPVVSFTVSFIFNGRN
jgi:hypothetical protein